jgi:hypothetical protein
MGGGNPGNPGNPGNHGTSYVDPYKYVIVYGSFVNDKPKPRDIDVIYRDFDKAEVHNIVRSAFPTTNLPIDACASQTWDPEVHVPCDSQATNYQVLAGTPNVKIVRDYDNFTSILRERAGFNKALARINAEPFMELNIRETGNYIEYQHDTYSKGRKAFQDSVKYHFGRGAFKRLCEKLWYGELLYRLSEEPPINQDTVNAVGIQSSWSSEHHAVLIFDNKNTTIRVSHDYKRWMYPGTDVQTWLRRLYTMEPAYDWGNTKFS